MMPRSLSARLTLLFCAVSGAVLGIAAVGAEALVERALWASIDASLMEEAETLATIGNEGSPTAGATLAEVTEQIGRERDPGPSKFVRVTGPRGEMLASFGDAPERALAGSAPIEMYATGGHTVRVARYRAPGRSCLIGVRVDGPIEQRRRSRLAVGGAFAAVLAALGGLAWGISRRATRELERLADELETIEAASLDRRLAARSVAEVDRLASVLNRLLARLERAMHALRDFTTDAAHELRTPIAALRTHLELAAGGEAAARDPRLADAIAQTERLQSVAGDLLTLSELESIEPAFEIVDLAEIAREVGEFFEPLAEAQGRPFRSAVAPARVAGSPALLKRLLLNLVDNAFRHAPSPAAIDVRVSRSGDRAVIEVADRGPGIDSAELPRIFERFRRGRRAPSGGGSGLGLAICREIVTRHRGAIAIDPAPGGGARVRVTLPLV